MICFSLLSFLVGVQSLGRTPLRTSVALGYLSQPPHAPTCSSACNIGGEEVIAPPCFSEHGLSLSFLHDSPKNTLLDSDASVGITGTKLQQDAIEEFGADLRRGGAAGLAGSSLAILLTLADLSPSLGHFAAGIGFALPDFLTVLGELLAAKFFLWGDFLSVFHSR